MSTGGVRSLSAKSKEGMHVEVVARLAGGGTLDFAGASEGGLRGAAVGAFKGFIRPLRTLQCP